MQALYELIQYCNMSYPPGALLLTGEWGCGKTYLVEKQLRDELRTKNSIIRVSLFGLQTIEEINRAVKIAWIEQSGGIGKQIYKIQQSIKESGISEIIPEPLANSVLKGFSSVDFINFIKLKEKNDKRITLVFDDLERSRLDTIDLLGAINEYCENQGLNVIIIANEIKISSSDIKSKYEEIKEKVIYRTIHYEPDYQQVVGNILDNLPDGDYKCFLKMTESKIVNLFTRKDNEVPSLESIVREHQSKFQNNNQTSEKAICYVKRPHNIRSLIVAVRDFEYVFDALTKKHANNIDRWLASFITFTMAARANLIAKDKTYRYLLVGEFLDSLYPGYYDGRFMPECLCDWIINGIRDHDALEAYINEYYQSQNYTPSEWVKRIRIDYLDETIAQEGMTKAIEEAYDSLLTLNQYIFIIINAKLAREYGLEIPVINWQKVQTAINRRIHDMINNLQEEPERNREMISENQGYSEDEWKTYQIISEARKQQIIALEKDRKEYINGIVNNPEETLMISRSKRFNRFDDEMAEATIEGYKKADNSGKGRFPACIKDIWGRYNNSFDIKGDNVEITRKGLLHLRAGLEELNMNYNDAVFKKKITTAFIDTINNILNEQKQQTKRHTSE